MASATVAKHLFWEVPAANSTILERLMTSSSIHWTKLDQVTRVVSLQLHTIRMEGQRLGVGVENDCGISLATLGVDYIVPPCRGYHLVLNRLDICSANILGSLHVMCFLELLVDLKSVSSIITMILHSIAS